MYVWDINLRFFHWLLVFFITSSIISAKFNNLFLHQYFGSISLGLILFRIYWGFFGTYNAIFKNFFYSPKEIFYYLKGDKVNNKKTGHNPLGSLSVFSFYILIMVLGWPMLAVAALGFFERWAGFRLKYGGLANDLKEEE